MNHPSLVPLTLAVESYQLVLGVVVFFALLLLIGGLIFIVTLYRKVPQGTALVRTGMGGPRVTFSGMVVVPVVHREELMDISVKRLEIFRHGSEGLICKDNVRADIKVAFFVRVNNAAQDVLNVAQSIGVRRASDQATLVELFDSKFSEALKTVGKQFEFVDLYSEREKFKEQILKVIGRDLNGFVLDDAAIDYLEQTKIESLDPDNILDAEGIRKITDLTARQMVLANDIAREKEKTIKKQDVEAREAILELERQQEEAEARQAREISTARSREQAEADKVKHEEWLKSERARLQAEEEVGVQQENKLRQVLIAEKAKQRTEAVEQERVTRERDLEATERERLVELARIEKEKALEEQRKAIQDVIRERVVVERSVATEEEKIQDTRQFADADRKKKVRVTAAEASAQEELIRTVTQAEAAKQAEQFEADQMLIEASAKQKASDMEAAARKTVAGARTAEAAAQGLAEAEVMDAKAGATQKYGAAEAEVTLAKGEAEATASRLRFAAEAEGITQKAEAMKLYDGVGREHEEFKLRLDKDKQIELAAIDVQRAIAAEGAKVLGEALRSAKIDIVGGDGQFFDRIVNSITTGKQIDRMVSNSDTLGSVKRALLEGVNGSANGDGEHDGEDGDLFANRVRRFVGQFGLESEDVKNLTIAAAITKMMGMAEGDGVRSQLESLLGSAKDAGVANQKVG